MKKKPVCISYVFFQNKRCSLKDCLHLAYQVVSSCPCAPAIRLGHGIRILVKTRTHHSKNKSHNQKRNKKKTSETVFVGFGNRKTEKHQKKMRKLFFSSTFISLISLGRIAFIDTCTSESTFWVCTCIMYGLMSFQSRRFHYHHRVSRSHSRIGLLFCSIFQRFLLDLSMNIMTTCIAVLIYDLCCTV